MFPLNYCEIVSNIHGLEANVCECTLDQTHIGWHSVTLTSINQNCNCFVVTNPDKSLRFFTDYINLVQHLVLTKKQRHTNNPNTLWSESRDWFQNVLEEERSFSQNKQWFNLSQQDKMHFAAWIMETAWFQTFLFSGQKEKIESIGRNVTKNRPAFLQAKQFHY